MEKIYVIDLTDGNVEEVPYDILTEKDYGRGLAHRLLREYTPIRAGRLSPENAIVLVPGLFAGCAAPSSGRISFATKGAENNVIIGNTAGSMPQLLGSLGICAVVIKGCDEKRNAVVHIDENGVDILHLPQLEGQYATSIIKEIKAKFGCDAAIMGTGIAGDMQLPLSTMFNTYVDGFPEFNCPRSLNGDIAGSKGLRAIVVNGKGRFIRGCANNEDFKNSGKLLTATILENDMCGKALPLYGSVAILHLLKNKKFFDEHASIIPKQKCNNSVSDKKINYNCAPMCVVGCLNRHTANSGEIYSSPDETELAAAIKENFDIEDSGFLKALNNRLRDICLDSLEFVSAAKCYSSIINFTLTKESILSLVDEVENGSDIGRLIGSRTEGMLAAFPNCVIPPSLKEKITNIQSTSKISINKRKDKFDDISDVDMLYHQVFLLENLGICLFTAFALVNNDNALRLLAKMYREKTGDENMTEDDLILYAQKCIKSEVDYLKENGNVEAVMNIPGFAKVLYHYFSH